MRSKPVILVVTSFLVVALIYGLSYTVRVFAVPPEQGWKDSGSCDSHSDPDVPNVTSKTCCWTERAPGSFVYARYCQTCYSSDVGPPATTCDPKVKGRTVPRGLTNVPQGSGVIEQPPKHSLKDNAKLPKGGGVLEQPHTGESTAKKGNNDNSPTPPACPDKGPIPPNCTLKPKF